MHDEGKGHRRRVEAEVQQPLGDVDILDAVILEVRAVDDELVHRRAFVFQRVMPL